MPYLSKLPTRSELAESPAAGGPYGPRCNWHRTPLGVILLNRQGDVLVDERGVPDLTKVDRLTVAYANAFNDYRPRIETYWRTHRYRLVGEIGQAARPQPDPEAVLLRRVAAGLRDLAAYYDRLADRAGVADPGVEPGEPGV